MIYNYHNVKEYYTKLNCILLETEYKNIFTKMKYKCACGNIYENTFQCFKRAEGRCIKCSRIKTINTNLEKYGGKSPASSKDIQDKMKETNLKKYGCENPFGNKDIQDKIKETNLENLGVEYPGSSKKVQDKMKESNLEKHGYENAMQNIDIFIKQQESSYKLKEYIFPSGKIIKCQGYEPFTLDILLQTYNEESIIIETHLIPKIKYELDGTKHYYFPDIFLPNENKIIEVKSDYTYNALLEKNLAKRKATLDNGYLFEFWIFDKNKNLTIL